MFSDQRNLILAIVLSLSILLAFEFFYNAPRPAAGSGRQQAIEQILPRTGGDAAAPSAQRAPGTPPEGVSAPALGPRASMALQRARKIEQSPRITIESAKLSGTLALTGGQLDDIVLNHYREHVEPHSPNITMLSPLGAPHPTTSSSAGPPSKTVRARHRQAIPCGRPPPAS